jgi:hypothetical protein
VFAVECYLNEACKRDETGGNILNYQYIIINNAVMLCIIL